MISATEPGATPTRQERELANDLRVRSAGARRLIEARLEDAAQFASAGRIPTAEARIGELTSALIERVSHDRSHFYRQSFDQHRRAGLDPAVHDLNAGPSPDGAITAMTAPIFGRSHAVDLDDLLQDARAALQTAALASGQPSIEPTSWLENWRSEYADRIGGTVHRMLSDSQIALFEAVGQILVRPEFR